jgi:ribosome-binding protein aMBF1 (putative translation factor)
MTNKRAYVERVVPLSAELADWDYRDASGNPLDSDEQIVRVGDWLAVDGLRVTRHLTSEAAHDAINLPMPRPRGRPRGGIVETAPALRRRFAERLTARRHVVALTIPELAAIVRKSDSAVRSWENARTWPSLGVAIRIAEALECEIGELI